MLNRLLQTILLFLLLASSASGQDAEKKPIFSVPFTVGAQFYDYQNYHQVPYLHGGIDLCAPAGSEVICPVSGQVEVNSYEIDAGNQPHRFVYKRKPFKQTFVSNTRYLEVAVTDNARNTWMFRHIEPSSVPSEVFTAAEYRGLIPAGTIIGRVARWILPVKPEPGLYHHIHLEIIASSGEYLNPADFVATGKDYYPPTIQQIYLVDFGRNQSFIGSTQPVVTGKISIIAGLTDRMNRAAYLHGVYSAQVELLHFSENEKQWRQIKNYQAYRFDRLPIIGDRSQLASVIYRDRIFSQGRTVQANGNDGPRFFLLNLTAGESKRGYHSYNGLDTRDLANGYYRVIVKVADLAGNERSSQQDFIVRN